LGATQTQIGAAKTLQRWQSGLRRRPGLTRRAWRRARSPGRGLQHERRCLHAASREPRVTSDFWSPSVKRLLVDLLTATSDLQLKTAETETSDKRLLAPVDGHIAVARPAVEFGVVARHVTEHSWQVGNGVALAVFLEIPFISLQGSAGGRRRYPQAATESCCDGEKRSSVAVARR
jgi:hypothetical protein